MVPEDGKLTSEDRLMLVPEIVATVMGTPALLSKGTNVPVALTVKT